MTVFGQCLVLFDALGDTTLGCFAFSGVVSLELGTLQTVGRVVVPLFYCRLCTKQGRDALSFVGFACADV